VLTALALVGALVAGVILASDVFHSGSEVDTLLFGSLFSIAGRDLVMAAVASAAALAATIFLGPRWLAAGFDPSAARAIGARSRLPDLALDVGINSAETHSRQMIPSTTCLLHLDRSMAGFRSRFSPASSARERRRPSTTCCPTATASGSP
jgi:hypothetical protein